MTLTKIIHIASHVISLAPMAPPILQNFIRKTPSVAPILHRGVLAVTGSHSTEFLNGLLSSSIREPPRNKFSSFLHAQARTLRSLSLRPVEFKRPFIQ